MVYIRGSRFINTLVVVAVVVVVVVVVVYWNRFLSTLTETGRQKLERPNSWKQAKQKMLFYPTLVSKEETFNSFRFSR